MFENIKNRTKKKWLEVALLGVMAVVLGFAVWQVFLKDKQPTSTNADSDEIRLVSILETINGVGDAEVMIGRTEDGIQSVVVVCEGANKISVLIDVREAAATALGIEQKYVKVYLKK